MSRFIVAALLLLFFSKCSTNKEYSSFSETVIDQKDKSWPIFADYQDYDLQDFWPKNQDSSLFSIIKEFDDNNRNIQLIDIQSKINSTYYDINVSNS